MSVATKKTGDQKRRLGETVKIVIQALLLALVVRTFLFQPFNIPSGSMRRRCWSATICSSRNTPTAISRYSLPVLARICSRAASGRAEPQRGDIVVFKLPRDDSTDYIKRVIGLPGDRSR